MMMTPEMRKLTLTLHVTTSMGWFGAVAAFLALAIVGLSSGDAQTIRAAYVGMEILGWWVIVPLALVSLPIGILQSLGTEWGLFRHYWVAIKLVITVLATAILLVHMQPIGHMATAAAMTTLSRGDLRQLRIQLVADAAAALGALFVATALSVYKPKGVAPYGRRPTATAPRWMKTFGIAALLLILLVLILHLTGRGLHGH